MAQSDGWVGECVSSDHTIIPDLSDWSEPVSPVITDEIYHDETPEIVIPEPARRGPARVLVGLLVVAVIGVGGLFGWPLVAEFLEEEKIPTNLARVGEPTQKFVISGGTIYLEGTVPDQEVSRFIEQAAQNALGTDRVINNFEISDDAVFDPNQPVLLSVAETVLFPTGQAQVNQEYAPLIDLAVELMMSQPKTVLRIVGHTDDQGPDDINLRLSIDRANAVADEIERRGVDRPRLTVEGRGEAEPMASNDTTDGRSANRRVEFLISGLLG